MARVIWLYFRFNLSLREVEEVMLERGVDVGDLHRPSTSSRCILKGEGEGYLIAIEVCQTSVSAWFHVRPRIQPGDVVVMDNLSSHKAPWIREMIEAAGAKQLASSASRSTVPTSSLHYAADDAGNSCHALEVGFHKAHGLIWSAYACRKPS